MLFCQQFNNSNDIDSIFRESCESYYESVLKYCICMIGHNEDAKDCTQEAFTGYYKALLSGKKIKKHHAYILKIAKNICNQRLRMMEKHDKEIASFLEHYQLYGQLSLEEQFDNDAIDGKVEQIAQSIIESLSATEKDLYYNYFINRLTAKQIANIKHESPSFYSPTGLKAGYYYRATVNHYAKEKGWFFPASQKFFNETNYILVQ